MRRLSTSAVTGLSLLVGLLAACLLYKHAWQFPVLQDLRDAKLFFALWILATPLAAVMAALGRAAKWRSALKSAALCLCISAPLYGITSSFGKVRSSSQQKAVLCNLRQLVAAADQYFLENGATVVRFEELVGPDKYVKAVNSVVGEDYRPTFPFHQGGILSVELPNGTLISDNTGAHVPDFKAIREKGDRPAPRPHVSANPSTQTGHHASPPTNITSAATTAGATPLSDAALERELGRPMHKTHRGTMCASCHAKKR